LFDDDKLINYITTRTVLWLVRRTDARQYKNYYKQTNTHTHKRMSGWRHKARWAILRSPVPNYFIIVTC